MRTSPLLALTAALAAAGLSGCYPPSGSLAASCGDDLVTAYIDASGGIAPDPATVGAPPAGFEPARALSGLDVACSITFVAPGNGVAGTQRVSIAVVHGSLGAAIGDTLTRFVNGNGYVSDEDHPDGGDGFEWWQLLEEGEGGVLYAAEQLHFDEIDPVGTATGFEEMALETTIARPGDWIAVNIDERR